MGADTFTVTATGQNARVAFYSAVERAQYMSGHGGYTGTIAEKHSFVVISDTTQDVRRKLAKEAWDEDGDGADHARIIAMLDRADSAKEPMTRAVAIARALMEMDDQRIDDKWGPAGCIHVEGATYLFFGWASS